MKNIDKTIDDLLIWLRERVEEAGAKGLVFGLSGGIDSAVMAGLAKKAFPNNSLGLIMPCHSKEEDEEDARLVAEALGLEVEKIDLTKTYDSLIKEAGAGASDLARSNIKPRLRMTSLYYVGQNKSYLVAGPTNKSEFEIGYFTKYGDSGVDLLPLVDFLKEDIYRLAEALQIPEKIINKKPSAGLVDGQTDEEDMGFDYGSLDGYLKGQATEKDLSRKIARMNKASKHKREYPPMFIIKN